MVVVGCMFGDAAMIREIFAVGAADGFFVVLLGALGEGMPARTVDADGVVIPAASCGVAIFCTMKALNEGKVLNHRHQALSHCQFRVGLESGPDFRGNLQVGKCVFVFNDDDFVFGWSEVSKVGVVGMKEFREKFLVAEVGRDVGEADARCSWFEGGESPSSFKFERFAVNVHLFDRCQMTDGQ